MKRRWTAALLALVLAVSLLPGTARADAGERLTGVDRAVYDILRAEILRVAAGGRSDTSFRIPDQPELSWTLEELDAAGQGDILSKVSGRLAQALHLDRIYACLSADLPYEMFWKGNEYSWGYSYSCHGDRVYITDLTIPLFVSQDYRGGSSTTVSAAGVEAARQAAELAQAIVNKYADRTDYEKLSAYREELCRLADYNQSVGAGTPYGNPWQMVYVFDGDPNTNVVCEGYSKAFQYLCDLSRFAGDVACYTVTGDMNGGAHMWNIVRMDDGEHYIVDITNCDDGAIGAPDALFLAGAAGDGQTYTVSSGLCRAVYTYSDSERGMFAEDFLPVSAADYVYDPSRAPVRSMVAPFTDVFRGDYCDNAVEWAAQEHIAQGTSETTFSPDEPCTHAQILTFLWRAAGEPDSEAQAPVQLTGDEFYAGALRWAAELEMTDPDFDPEAPCRRGDAVRYIWQAFHCPPAPASAFDDVAPDSLYAQAVDWAVEQAVTLGATETSFQPEEICTRGQIVTFLHRAHHGTPAL